MDYQPTSRRVLCGRFMLGMFWLAGVAGVGSAMSGASFLVTYVAVICGALFTSAICLAWLVQWAMNENARRGQFGIASLLFLITLLAVYFAAVRFLVVNATPPGGPPLAKSVLIWSASICLIGAVCSIPFVLGLIEALLRFAVWLVRHPQTRRWVIRLRR